MQTALTWLPGNARRRNLIVSVLAAVMAIAALAAVTAPSARADAFGEIGSPLLSPGEGPDQLNGLGFYNSFGVDPSDGSFFVAAWGFEGADEAVPLRKFSATGTKIATVQLPYEPPGVTNNFLGAAVASDKTYVLETRVTSPDSENTAAARILAYSTSDLSPQGELEVPDPEGSEAIIDPFGIALDPSTGDILLAGYTGEPLAAGTHIVVQRIDPDGGAGDRFEDSGGTIVEDMGFFGPGFAFGFAVADDGTSYVAVGRPDGIGGKVYSLSPGFDAVTNIAPITLPEVGAINTSSIWFSPAPRFAVAPDGKTVYVDTHRSPTVVYGISTLDGKKKVVYGGGTSSCAIAAANNSEVGLATRGDELYVLDIPSFGLTGGHVLRFGPGGSGCPWPTPRFTVAGGDPEASATTVQKGQEVELTADTSQLHGATATLLEWKIEQGGEEFSEVVPQEPTPSLTLEHKFVKVGTATVSLKVELTGGSFTEVPPVVKTITVDPGHPTAVFDAPGEATTGAPVSFDASRSVDPTGSPEGETTHTMALYKWDFGDGTAETTQPTISHSFTVAGAHAVHLTVKSVDGVEASTTRNITVTSPGGGGGDTGGGDTGGGSQTGTTPSPGPAPAPTPTPTPNPKPKLTPKQRALAKCKKLKGKAKSACIKKAQKKAGHKKAGHKKGKGH